MPTVDIKGKPYVLVKDRIMAFHDLYPEHRLVTTHADITPEYAVFTASVLDPEGNIIADGTAREERTKGGILATSYVEVAATSAKVRALACFGIGIAESISSADEVKTAMEDATVTEAEYQRLEQLVLSKGKSAQWLLDYCKVKEPWEIKKAQYAHVVMNIDKL